MHTSFIRILLSFWLDCGAAFREYDAELSLLSTPTGDGYRTAPEINRGAAIKRNMMVASPPLRPGEWDIFGSTGPKLSDVSQGDLGNCYVVASLAAIAYFQPQIIENMFGDVKGVLNPSGPYVSNWLINGMPRQVAVTDEVPVDPDTGRPFFTDYNSGANFWTVILEKAWAKIFGSFKAAELGWPEEVFTAITQAPVETLRWTHGRRGPEEASVLEGSTKVNVWNKLLEATEKKFPMTAASVDNSNVKIPGKHAFAVLGAVHLQGHGRAVEVYNPWAKSTYKGTIPYDQQQGGRYFLTFDEFWDSFFLLNIAQTQPGYTVSSIVLARETQETTKVFRFEMKKSDSFAVQLVWPSKRLLEGCKVALPEFTLAVSKVTGTDTLSVVTLGTLPSTDAWRHSNAIAKMLGGAGTYLVFVTARFPDAPQVQEFVLNVYSAEERKVIFHADSRLPATERFLEMLKFGGRQSVPNDLYFSGQDFRKRSDKLVSGVPTYMRVGCGSEGDTNRKSVIYWRASLQKWLITDTLSNAKTGSHYASFDFTRDCTLTQGGASAAYLEIEEDLSPALDLGEKDDEYDAAIPHGADSLAQKTEVKTLEECKRILEGLGELDNSEDISKTGTDEIFPTTQTSIGSTNAVCGDLAKGVSESCAKYNHWDTFANVIRKEAEDDALLTKCFHSSMKGNKCKVQNKCEKPVVIQCLLESGEIKRARLPVGKKKITVDLYLCSCKRPERPFLNYNT